MIKINAQYRNGHIIESHIITYIPDSYSLVPQQQQLQSLLLLWLGNQGQQLLVQTHTTCLHHMQALLQVSQHSLLLAWQVLDLDLECKKILHVIEH